MRQLIAILLATAVFAGSLHAGDDNARAAEWAKENVAAGKYNDAIDILAKALPTFAEGSKERRDTTLALIEVLRIVGDLARAREYCTSLLKANEKDTDTQLILAEIDVATGNYKEARAAYDKIIAEQPKNYRAWALRSFVLRLLSDREMIKKTNDFFFDLYQKNVDYYNSTEVKDPLELAYIAVGIQDEMPKDAFEVGFMLAEDIAKERGMVLPEVLLWCGRLAHEKYHFGFAQERYTMLAKLRPKYPDALSGMAAIILQTTHKLDDVEKLLKDALSVNPNHVESHLIYAAVDMQEDRMDSARQHIEAALKVNPNDIQALATHSAYLWFMGQGDKMKEIEAKVLAIHPKCADYYCELGEALENKFGYDQAPAYYQKAIDLDPENWRGYYCLGMSLSRQGTPGVEKGKALLLKAFEKNRFNVWASNMIKALDRIIGDKEQNVPPVYAEANTKNFSLKFYNKEAAIVRPYMEEWAEYAYDWQTKKFGFQPQGPLTIELSHSFQDQAARTVGLPNLGALGVCFGKLCTVVSPREGKQKAFNWRKVLEHEFGHVMTLQMTKFRVPRWFTEAFSTYIEDDSRIESDQMMVDAIAKGYLKNIENMNEYFRINPLMAYVHGRYVIEYLDKEFGFNALVKALHMFAEGKKVHEVLPAVTGKDLKTLNEGQLAYTKKSFEQVRRKPSYDQAMLVQLELAAKGDDATAQAIADFAVAQVALRKHELAGQLADKALEKDPKCVDALNLKAFLAYDKKDFEGAKQLYQQSTQIDPSRSFAAWHRLGIIYKKEGKTTKAIEAFEAARKSYPRYVGPDNPHHVLPELYADMEPAQNDKALAVWLDAVKINTEDPEAARKGMQLALKLKDWKAVLTCANAHIEVNPYVVEVHLAAGKAYEEFKEWGKAAREYEVATALNDKDVESWVGLARVHKANSKFAEALAAVRKALAIDGTHAEAKALRDELGPKN